MERRIREPPPNVAAYQSLEYWDQRFAEEEHYDWLKDYSHFRHLILANVKPTDSILELGCGNSLLSLQMYEDGFSDITCTDLSSVAIQQMQHRLESIGCQGIKLVVADMLDLPFQDNLFDIVIDKGAMDVLFVNSNDPWDPQPETKLSVYKMLSGVHRVLKPDGMFIDISFGQPHFRRPLFENQDFTWSMDWKTFGDGFHYFFYTLRKGTKKNFSLECYPGRKFKVDMLQEHIDNEDYLLNTFMDELDG